MSRQTMQRALWISAGIGLGAASTWLLATREGQRATRRAGRKIAHLVEDGCERIKDVSEDVFDQGKHMLDRGSELVKETTHEVGRRLHVAS